MSSYEDWVASTGTGSGLSDWAKTKVGLAFEQHSVRSYLDLRAQAGLGSSSRVAMMFNFGDGHAGSRADFTCDKCGAYTPSGLVLWPISFFATREDAAAAEGGTLVDVLDKAVLVITIGLCQRCALEEHLDEIEPSIRDH